MSLSNKRKERKECKKQEKNRLLKETSLSPGKHVKVLKNTFVLQNFETYKQALAKLQYHQHTSVNLLHHTLVGLLFTTDSWTSAKLHTQAVAWANISTTKQPKHRQEDQLQ